MLTPLRSFWIRFFVCCEPFMLPKLTIPRLLWFVYVFGWGAYLAGVMRSLWGTSGFLLGFAFGTVMGVLHPMLLLWALLVLFYPCPPCRSGNCRRYTDYAWRKWTFFGYEKYRV